MSKKFEEMSEKISGDRDKLPKNTKALKEKICNHIPERVHHNLKKGLKV